MNIPEEDVRKSREIFSEVPQLDGCICKPDDRHEEEGNVIDRVFPESIRNFLKTACRYRRMDLMQEIFAAYDRCRDEQDRVIRTRYLHASHLPTEAQKKGMEAFLCRKYGAEKADITVAGMTTLFGGFILRVGSDEYDWSMKGRLDRLTKPGGLTLTWR